MALSRRTLLATTLAAPPLAARAQDQAFPRQPIRVVVPFPAGGTTDLLARLFAQRMSQTLGQPVVVENRGGGGGSIGADVVAKAAPDGHTLLFHNITFPTTTATLSLAGRAPHEIERDFVAVSLGAYVPFVILANPAVPAQDLKGFVEHARARAAAGQPLFYGSTGPGSIMNLVGEVLKRETGIAMDHVPFRGAAPLVQELVAGRVQLGGDQLSTSFGHVRSGALRGLATIGARRAAVLPEVPTAREQGFPALELEGWNGFFAPARTPPGIVARLQQAVADAAQQPEIRRRCEEVGAEPAGSSSEEFARMVRAQAARIRELVAAVQLRPE
ncbi:Bug family tripartite tricarboxylate transporter substrate binding protein [Caldovatus aquaticus]|uniref:Tripartite tricarboxylate transporter substrate binding protein n=1 Tax=Caldovatus aquaticus TaxID=2865671 RepID=A0ABS7F914_9PROT|nr:tripartite tricarboxylate transporter substrate-binding protein [Caldovatus aquaticus]MBW8271270.1 tripartite tricarboxylate transporter substrate binding protein [Caldovatus aquaticus]